MKNLLIISGMIGAVAIVSCEDHEVIPPPVPMVDLNCECDAIINDSTVSYSDTCTYASVKTIGTPGTSDAEYFTTVWNEGVGGGQNMELEMRSISWIDNGNNKPTLNEWQAFFNDNTEPAYSTAPADLGVVLRWTDPNNKVWVSDSSTVCVSNFEFTQLVQESDTTGQYMKFQAEFSCVMLNSDYGTVDSVKCVENGFIKSAFRLD
ncbi:MAG: hypothetical protein MI810_18975 [Flavobacteriales bacterium]|jgi:hypothetical protein|nr:hypothetical protein [Flavobacteriales bacterium]